MLCVCLGSESNPHTTWGDIPTPPRSWWPNPLPSSGRRVALQPSRCYALSIACVVQSSPSAHCGVVLHTAASSLLSRPSFSLALPFARSHRNPAFLVLDHVRLDRGRCWSYRPRGICVFSLDRCTSARQPRAATQPTAEDSCVDRWKFPRRDETQVCNGEANVQVAGTPRLEAERGRPFTIAVHCRLPMCPLPARVAPLPLTHRFGYYSELYGLRAAESSRIQEDEDSLIGISTVPTAVDMGWASG
mgnify:CR=1 FL=1